LRGDGPEGSSSDSPSCCVPRFRLARPNASCAVPTAVPGAASGPTATEAPAEVPSVTVPAARPVSPRKTLTAPTPNFTGLKEPSRVPAPLWDNSTSRRLRVVRPGLSQARSRAYHGSFRSPPSIRKSKAQTRVSGCARPRPSGGSSFRCGAPAAKRRGRGPVSGGLASDGRLDRVSARSGGTCGSDRVAISSPVASSKAVRAAEAATAAGAALFARRARSAGRAFFFRGSPPSGGQTGGRRQPAHSNAYRSYTRS